MRTKLRIVHAESKDNGIYFYSNRHKGHVAIATIDEKGEIKTNWTTVKEEKKNKSNEEKIKDFFLVLSVIFFVLLIQLIMNKNPFLGIRIFLIGFSLMLILQFIINNSKKTKDDTYKFHSAEHMVCNAYKKLGRVPSIEESKQYSLFSNSCSTNLTTQFVIAFVLMFICTFIPNALYRILGMVCVNVIVFLLVKLGYLNFLQKFTTKIPTEKELAVAIEGMKLWLENEKKDEEKN